MAPVEELAKLRGLKNEQQNVRQDDLQSLIDYGKEHGSFPPSLREGLTYAPFINVDSEGKAFVNEGNHRIMAAKALGWTHVPIEVRYFSGGEQAKGGFTPEMLARWDAEARAAGANPGRYAEPAKGRRIDAAMKRMVTMQVNEEETGRRVDMQMPAHEALDHLDKSIQRAKDLLSCLSL